MAKSRLRFAELRRGCAAIERDASGHRAEKDVDGEKTVFFNLGTS